MVLCPVLPATNTDCPTGCSSARQWPVFDMSDFEQDCLEPGLFHGQIQKNLFRTASNRVHPDLRCPVGRGWLLSW